MSILKYQSLNNREKKKTCTIQTKLNPWWNTALCTPLDKLIWPIPHLHSQQILWEGTRGEGSSWQCWLQPRVETLLLSWQQRQGLTANGSARQEPGTQNVTFRIRQQESDIQDLCGGGDTDLKDSNQLKSSKTRWCVFSQPVPKQDGPGWSWQPFHQWTGSWGSSSGEHRAFLATALPKKLVFTI